MEECKPEPAAGAPAKRDRGVVGAEGASRRSLFLICLQPED